MPIYEYRCQNCGRKLSLLVRRREEAQVSCPHCGSADLKRLFSSFAIRRTDQTVYEDILSDQRLIRGMEANDPKALVEWNRRMSRGMDTDTAMEPEHKEMIEQMERGQMPAKASPAGEEEE